MRILAALAIVANLCSPFIGQLRAATPQGEQVICTVHGVMTIPVPADRSPTPAKPVCALCAAAAVALDSAAAFPLTPVEAATRSETFLSLSAPQRAYRSPVRPRAPPALS